MTAEQVTLPGGRKLCPGWTSEFRTRGDGTLIPVLCGESVASRRSAEQAVIGPHADMCARCRKAKAKYDEENGARQQREQEAAERYEGLIDAYVDDLRLGLTAKFGPSEGNGDRPLRSILTVLDALRPRSIWPPYARMGEPEYRHLAFNDREISEPDKLNILRRAAGLPIERTSRNGW
jgi:hypothetical protein